MKAALEGLEPPVPVTGETITTASGLKYIDQIIATSGITLPLPLPNQGAWHVTVTLTLTLTLTRVHGSAWRVHGVCMACARAYLLASRMARPEPDGREHRRLQREGLHRQPGDRRPSRLTPTLTLTPTQPKP